MKNTLTIAITFLVFSSCKIEVKKIEYTDLEQKVISGMSDVDLLSFTDCVNRNPELKSYCFSVHRSSLKENCVQQSSGGSSLVPLAVGAAAGYMLAPKGRRK